MDRSSNKGLLILIAILVITNLVMIWYFTRPKAKTEKKSNTERMADYVRKELNFDDAQTQQYIQLRARRDSQLAPLNLSLRQAKLDLVKLIQDSTTSDSAIDLATQRVGQMQVPVERAYFNHFRRLANVCRPEQKQLFYQLLERTVKRNTGDTSQTQRR